MPPPRPAAKLRSLVPALLPAATRLRAITWLSWVASTPRPPPSGGRPSAGLLVDLSVVLSTVFKKDAPSAGAAPQPRLENSGSHPPPPPAPSPPTAVRAET